MFDKQLEFRSVERRMEAFGYFDKAIESGTAPSRSGAVLNQIIDPASGYPLLSGQILDVVATRGGVAAHLARGMDAWVEGNDRGANLHFKVASALSPNALGVMRYAALYLAREGSSAITVFTGQNKSAYQRSFELLDVVDSMGGELGDATLFDRCSILALRSDWDSILGLLEPRLDGLGPESKVRAYDWFVKAYEGLDEKEKVKEYQRMLQNALVELRATRNER
jgi:hypothetical protein